MSSSSLLSTSTNLTKPTRFPLFCPSGRSLSRRILCLRMSCTLRNVPTLQTVSISYSELKDKNADLSMKIEEGFGPNGLGILSVSDVPGYSSLRQNLLHLSPRLANLPEEVKKELEDPASRYNFGWSHGKEKLESGKPDTFKGSFYANPILDKPTTEISLIQRYPSYCQPNIWPDNALPELEADFKALGKLILDIGLMLAFHCDRYVSKWMVISEDEGLEQILLRSRCHKGRLLYYFPAQQRYITTGSVVLLRYIPLSWLLYLTVIPLKLPAQFLHGVDGIRTMVHSQVVFQEDQIAYQIGETSEILSAGHLCATPHCVRAPKGENTYGVERSTFALFMQPDWDENLKFPREMNLHQECVIVICPTMTLTFKTYPFHIIGDTEKFLPPNGTLTFGEYSEKLLDKYYHLKQ
ncbi:hypothetical protein GIB67_035484 [Kingdonia uniflora]|uniref:Non-haem dioxygenase N-terminal domain-containing protein n=1 Tax=Kingdonia uniflora TaxID=39325 RepID=A0A7J7P0T0_9MAGN|nr:hypothetical protein GIB67_035484 [Kingdonia uniflora]